MASLTSPTLIVFGGLPGTGKTTVSRAVCRRIGALFLRIDAVEQAIRNSGIDHVGPAGYAVANAIAESNLRLGHRVVADCVNPVSESRQGWRDTAARSGAALAEIEIVCSDPAEHRRRVESRLPDLPGQRLPTWDEIATHRFEAWPGDRLVLDTAGTDVATLVDRAEAYLLGICC